MEGLMMKKQIKNFMKNVLMMMATFVLLAAGCVEDRLDLDDVPIGVDFTLPKGEKAIVDAVNGKLSIEIENVYDSRCPANAICILEGNYGVDLMISDATQSTPVKLCNLFCGSDYKLRDTASFVLNETEYQIVLKDLQPYPGTIENDEPKKVILEILK
jgi:hypothetical protein